MISLTELGLDEKEERLYRALLELGTASVSEATKTAGIHRTLGYETLGGLEKKGLVTQVARRGKKCFIAEPPEKLVDYTEQQSKQWKQRTSLAQEILPALSAQYRGIGTRPVVRYYEGVEGLKQIYEDSLTAKDMIRSYSAVETIKELMFDYAEKYFRRRAEKKIYIRAITKVSGYAVHLKQVQDRFMREIRLVPADKFNFTLERYIYNDKVAFMSFFNRFGVIIESKDIADSEKYIFELAWQAAKEYDREVERSLSSHKVIKS